MNHRWPLWPVLANIARPDAGMVCFRSRLGGTQASSSSPVTMELAWVFVDGKLSMRLFVSPLTTLRA
jgi:hypothetical protein